MAASPGATHVNKSPGTMMGRRVKNQWKLGKRAWKAER